MPRRVVSEENMDLMLGMLAKEPCAVSVLATATKLAKPTIRLAMKWAHEEGLVQATQRDLKTGAKLWELWRSEPTERVAK